MFCKISMISYTTLYITRNSSDMPDLFFFLSDQRQGVLNLGETLAFLLSWTDSQVGLQFFEITTHHREDGPTGLDWSVPGN